MALAALHSAPKEAPKPSEGMQMRLRSARGVRRAPPTLAWGTGRILAGLNTSRNHVLNHLSSLPTQFLQEPRVDRPHLSHTLSQNLGPHFKVVPPKLNRSTYHRIKKVNARFETWKRQGHSLQS